MRHLPDFTNYHIMSHGAAAGGENDFPAAFLFIDQVVEDPVQHKFHRLYNRTIPLIRHYDDGSFLMILRF